MKLKTKNVLRGMARHIGIVLKFVDYLDDDTHGKLLPREKRILINARKPRNEHIYTVLHEIGHYLIHFKGPPRKYHPRIFDINWTSEWLARLSSQVRRYFRFIFNREAGKEWGADVWAMCAFVYIARHFDCQGELFTFLKRHPEKRSVFLLAIYGTVYSGTKTRLIKIGQAVSMPFQTFWKFAMS
jgi:hypothetical protein